MRSESGQATIVGIGIVCATIVLAIAVVAVGSVYLDQTRIQQSADIAAASLANSSGDAPHDRAKGLAHANGAETFRIADSGSRVIVTANPRPLPLVPARMRLHATAVVGEFVAGPSRVTGGAHASGAHYNGSLVRVDASLVCPSVARDYASMQRAAALSGVTLYAVSGYRSVAEQAVLYEQLGARLAARPGTSLHHAATELDLAVGAAGSPTHRWLTMNAGAYGFTQRYSWEPWHWGNVRGC